MKPLHSWLALGILATSWGTGCGAETSTSQAPPPQVALTNANAPSSAPRPEPGAPVALTPPISDAHIVALETAPPEETAGTPITVPAPTGAPTPAKALNDSQIAAIAEAVIEGDLARARAIAKRTKSDSVRRLATLVASDEGASGAALTELEGRRPLASQGTQASETLRADDATATRALVRAKGTHVDEGYLDSQVDGTAHRIALLDQVLPDATDPELHTLLVDLRALLVTHQKAAEEASRAYRNHLGVPVAGNGSGAR